ncbi:hypothetical protein RchiOBHm_Chr5g0054871 [Rosa chinensis]|uniref:Uncharacterized protein n=1 Tax=Rosa chinensis TaxID=74649 RepID=A0A2P6QG88_ROSCH|nr:hypothetical protein RchiOBHm_Chr5g0054871 [Rosa chinensis]
MCLSMSHAFYILSSVFPTLSNMHGTQRRKSKVSIVYLSFTEYCIHLPKVPSIVYLSFTEYYIHLPKVPSALLLCICIAYYTLLILRKSRFTLLSTI